MKRNANASRWWHWICQWIGRHSEKTLRRAHRTRRLAFEALERRDVPAGFTDLHPLVDNVIRSVAEDINDAGLVAGSFTTVELDDFGIEHEVDHAGLSVGGGRLAKLGALAGGALYSSAASAINASGQVVGVSDRKDSNIPHAFLITPQDTNGDSLADTWNVPNPDGANELMIDLGAVGEVIDGEFYEFGKSAAFDVNNFGIAVGYSMAPSVSPTPFHLADIHAAKFSTAGHPVDLGVLGVFEPQPGIIFEFSQAMAVNDAGLIVGESSTSQGPVHAFLHDGSNMIDLGTLSGSRGYSRAVDINNQGWIIGMSSMFIGDIEVEHAFLYMNGQMIDLGDLADGGFVSAINNDGIVTGNRPGSGAFLLIPVDTDQNGAPDAWYRDTDGDNVNDLIINLETLPDGEVVSAHGINSSGQIAGVASLADGSTHAVANFQILQPVDIKVTSLRWDAVQGGVTIDYEVNGGTAPGQPTYNFYWIDAQGARLAGPLLTTGNQLVTAAGPHSAFEQGTQLGTPPSQAAQLLLVMDDGNQVIETAEDNNERAIAYRPRVEYLSATYDGNSDPQVLGRFFENVVTPQDEEVVFRISESLAGLAPAVGARLGGNDVPGNPKPDASGNWDGLTYSVALQPYLLPGDVKKNTPLQLGAVRDTTPLAGVEMSVEVLPLPAWLKVFSTPNIGTKTVTFDGTTGTYVIDGRLLYQVGEIFSIPAGMWLGGGKALGAKFAANLGVQVKAKLNPTQTPTTAAELKIELFWLSNSVYDKTVKASGNGPFIVTINLDQRTLEATSVTLQYKHTDNLTAGQALNYLQEQSFSKAVVAAISRLNFKPKLTTDIKVTIDAQGQIVTGSYADVSLAGSMNGTLVDIQLFNSQAIHTFSQAVQVIRNLNPATLTWNGVKSLFQYFGIIPEISARVVVSGGLTLRGRLLLSSGGVHKTEFHGRIAVTPQFQLVARWSLLGKPTLTRVLAVPTLGQLFTVDQQFRSW